MQKPRMQMSYRPGIRSPSMPKPNAGMKVMQDMRKKLTKGK